MKVPPSREITLENATEVEKSGYRLIPLNDGKDAPGWEYLNNHTVDGRVFRVPTRYTGEF